MCNRYQSNFGWVQKPIEVLAEVSRQVSSVSTLAGVIDRDSPHQQVLVRLFADPNKLSPILEASRMKDQVSLPWKDAEELSTESLNE